MRPIDAHRGKCMYFGSALLLFRGEIGFLNCDDICMCIVNKQYVLLDFV